MGAGCGLHALPCGVPCRRVVPRNATASRAARGNGVRCRAAPNRAAERRAELFKVAAFEDLGAGDGARNGFAQGAANQRVIVCDDNSCV